MPHKQTYLQILGYNKDIFKGIIIKSTIYAIPVNINKFPTGHQLPYLKTDPKFQLRISYCDNNFAIIKNKTFWGGKVWRRRKELAYRFCSKIQDACSFQRAI